MKNKLHLVVALIFAFIGYAQTGIGVYSAVDGGFENHTTTLAGGSGGQLVLSTSLWTTNTTGSIVRSSSPTGGRTGPRFVSLGATNGTAKTFFSPQMSGAFAPVTKYQIQFWYKTANSTSLEGATVDIYLDNNSTTVSGTKQSVAVTLSPNISTWTKVNAEITTNTTAATTNGIVGLTLDTPSTGYSLDFDDFIIYQGDFDNIAPSSPGAITATGALAAINVAWAAAAELDGGGYVVVRYPTSTTPSVSDDPLQNGIYAKGNTIGAGEVRYVGAATSFSDTGLSPGVNYHYKVYTVDKAFNYSDESLTSTPTQSLATTYYYNGTGLLTEVSSWGQNTNGTGTAPINFTDVSQVFEIRNTTAVTLDGVWTVGLDPANGTKVRLGNTDQVAITLTLNSGASIGPSGTGNFDVMAPSSGNHTVIYKGTTLVSFGNIFDADLEVIYDGVLVSTSSTKSFGTVSIINGANVTFTTNPIIKNMNVDAASTLVAPNNTANYITIPDGGSVTINGTVRVPKLTGFVSSGVTPSSAGGDIQFIGTENLTLGTNSTVEYIRDASSNQNITARTDYKNMTLGGTVPKTINGPVTVAGTLTINQTAPAAAVTLGGDLTVNGNLIFTLGKIITGSNTLSIGTSGSITGADQSTGWVVGNLKKQSASSISPSYTYAIGDATNYTPLALTFTGNTSVAGGLTAGINTGDHAQIATSGIDSTKSVNKTWTLTNDALTGFGTYSATFAYTSADNDAGATPSNYLVKLHDGLVWSSITTSGIPTDAATTATGISGFGDFAIGENAPLGLKENMSKAFTLYPNPVNNGVLYISSNTSSDKTIEIYDLLGKKVFSSGTISNRVEIESLKTGIYLARIKTDKEASIQKIIITNN